MRSNLSNEVESWPLCEAAWVATPDRIGEIAERALLAEVAVTPKMGLVDRRDDGAHADMNYFTFVASAAALAPFFHRVANVAWSSDVGLGQLLSELRPIGIEAEQAMFRATGGVNTHKGAIFSMGLFCAASSWIVARGWNWSVETLSDVVAAMTSGISERELVLSPVSDRLNPRSAGERLHWEYGVTGARGEAEAGFPSVVSRGAPALREALARGADLNDAGVYALICLLDGFVDTTVLNRHDFATLELVHKRAAAIRSRGSVFTVAGRRLILESNELFNNAGISPGGGADMLAVTLACHFMENESCASSGRLSFDHDSDFDSEPYCQPQVDTPRWNH